MAIGAFISISVATRGLEVAALANRLSNHGWRLITAVMVLFSLLGTTMGFSVETLGFDALFVPLMAALGYDRLVTALIIALDASPHTRPLAILMGPEIESPSVPALASGTLENRPDDTGTGG